MGYDSAGKRSPKEMVVVGLGKRKPARSHHKERSRAGCTPQPHNPAQCAGRGLGQQEQVNIELL